jgi:transcriptional regulator with XRE-family HTH domain
LASIKPQGSLPSFDLRLLGNKVRELRKGRGLSLDEFSRASGVSRAMLSQVELGKSAPTIGLVWRIARSLSVPLDMLVGDGLRAESVVLRSESILIVSSRDGHVQRRALFPERTTGGVEFHELILHAGAHEHARSAAPGATENIVVVRGTLTVVIRAERHSLRRGDAIYFGADCPHDYANDGTEDVSAYVVSVPPGR